jgi:hypothetical protein
MYECLRRLTHQLVGNRSKLEPPVQQPEPVDPLALVNIKVRSISMVLIQMGVHREK